MNVLALDTATLAASVAVLVDDQVTATRQARVTTHSEALLPLIDDALRDAGLAPSDVELVACGRGPGSFTGLRIGLATAKGLCFALGKPLVVVSSLAALALEALAEAPPDALVLALLDARKNEVYAGLYSLAARPLPIPLPMPLAVPLPVIDEKVLPPERLSAYLGEAEIQGDLWIVGEGALAYPDCARALGQVVESAAQTPQAAHVARLGLLRWQEAARDELATATPTYIRPSEAELKFKD